MFSVLIRTDLRVTNQFSTQGIQLGQARIDFFFRIRFRAFVAIMMIEQRNQINLYYFKLVGMLKFQTKIEIIIII